MKPAKACWQYRDGKRKCDRPTIGTACKQCLRRTLTCSSAAAAPLPRPRLSPQAQTTHSLQALPSLEQRQELCDLYIFHIHDKPHTLFHAPTLRQQVADGTISKAVLYGVLGLAARFSGHAEIRLQGESFSLESKRYLKADLDNLCLENVQACILVGNICGGEGNNDTEALFFGIAMRMAKILHLAVESTDEDAIVRETRRRVWWTLYMIDRWSAAGLGLPRELQNDSDYPELPIDEVTFHQMTTKCSRDIGHIPKPGLWAHMITLVKAFGQIQDLNQRLTKEDPPEEHVELSVARITEFLERYDRELPRDVQLNYC